MDNGGLLNPNSTSAVLLGAHDWSKCGLGTSQSFLTSAKGISSYLRDRNFLGLDPRLIIDLFDDPRPAATQLTVIRDALDAEIRSCRESGRLIKNVLVYYIGHGQTDDEGHLGLLLRDSQKGLEIETSIRAKDLARVLKIAAPQQRRIVILDCCFSEAAAKSFIGMAGSLSQAVASRAAHAMKDSTPARGSLLLCSSPVGEVSMAPSSHLRTLFTGAILEVLEKGEPNRLGDLSMADLRDAAYERMLISFGAQSPRPVLHQVNARSGDLTRIPIFKNRSCDSPSEGQSVGQNDCELFAKQTRDPSRAVNESDYMNVSFGVRTSAKKEKVFGVWFVLIPFILLAFAWVVILLSQLEINLGKKNVELPVLDGTDPLSRALEAEKSRLNGSSP